MKCPKCNDRSEVLETEQRKHNRTHRRRRCLNPHCMHRFTTSELNNDVVPAADRTRTQATPGPVEDDAVLAARAVDQRRAQIAREQRAERRRNRETWYETGFEPVPDLSDELAVRREIKGY